MIYRIAVSDDLPRIVKLYKAVAKAGGAIARQEAEITEEYVSRFITRSLEDGLIIVGEHPENPDELISEIHAYKAGIKVFNHVLSELTLVVHPEHQGRKIGRTIFTIFLEEIGRNRPDIGKVELFTCETNTKAIALYNSLGFKVEGRMEMRVKTPQGLYEADIPMGWQNPNFEF